MTTAAEGPDRGLAAPASARHLPVAVLALALLLTVVATVWVAHGTQQTLEGRFQSAVRASEALIRKRIDMNVALLSGLSGLLAVKPDASREEFFAYLDRVDLPRRYPGVFGVGFAVAFAPEQQPLVEERARQQGIEGFHVWPAGTGPERTSILYLEPANERNRAALGFDMASEPTRREAMLRARDTGEPALSGNVTLVQEITETKQAGFLLYVPVYEGGRVPDTVEERRAALSGYVYGVYRADDLFLRLYDAEPRPDVHIRVYDGPEARPEAIIHDSRDFADEVIFTHARLESTRQLHLYGRPWTVVVTSTPRLEPTREQAVAPLVGIAGTLVSFLFFALVRRQGDARQRAERLASEMLALSEERSLLLAKEQAAREEAEGANRLKDEFLATVSHELRTPLTAILGWTHILKGPNATPERVARGLEVIDRNARAQAQLIEDLLDVSRIITGKLHIQTSPIAVEQVIDGAVETLRHAAEAKRIQLSLDVEEGLSVVGDPARLQQVVWNLVSNAVKFTPEGGHVDVSARRRGDALTIAVRDTGKGIHPDFLPHVFERFRQAEGGTNRGYGGLGIGLAIVRHLVELHGGTVSVSSGGEGKGATFEVCLPLSGAPVDEPSPSPSALLEADRKRVSADALMDARVLVVDDEPDARDVLAAALESCGLRVTTASSAGEALEALRRERPDILLSDIGMPHEDGFQLIRRVRALPPEEGGGIRALAVTAYARAEERSRILAAGFDGHLAKPFDVDELLPALKALASARP